MSIRHVANYLVGSMAVYVAMAACSGDSPRSAVSTGDQGGGLAQGGTLSEGGRPQSVAQLGEGGLPSAGSFGTAGLEPAGPAQSGSGNGAPAGSGSGASGASGSGILDPVPVAVAQEDPASCASCTGTALRTITAEFDTSQEAQGTVTVPAAPIDTTSTVKVADGPLFLTHTSSPAEVRYYTVPSTSSCAFDPAGPDTTEAVEWEDPMFGPYAAHHQVIEGSLARTVGYGIKLRVMASEKLCASQVGPSRGQVEPRPRDLPAVTVQWAGFRPYQ